MENINHSLMHLSDEIHAKLSGAITMSSIMVGHQNLDSYSENLPEYFYTLEHLLMEISSMFDKYSALKHSEMEN